jgi:hypothetical protein
MRKSKNYLKLILMILSMALVLPLSSYGASRNNSEDITATGVVQKQGITTYMYGTHVMRDNDAHKFYALRSSSIDLDKYVGQNVTVKGTLVPGYPVDFGPDYLEVQSVKSNPD